MAGGARPDWHVSSLSSFLPLRGNDGDRGQCESWPDYSLSSRFPDPVSICVPSLSSPLLSVLFCNSLFTDTFKVGRFLSWERGGVRPSSPRASLSRVPGLRLPSLTKARSKFTFRILPRKCLTVCSDRDQGRFSDIPTLCLGSPRLEKDKNLSSELRELTYEGPDLWQCYRFGLFESSAIEQSCLLISHQHAVDRLLQNSKNAAIASAGPRP